MAGRRAVRQALRACATEHEWTQPVEALAPFLRAGGLPELVDAAVRHGIENLAYLSVRGLPHDVVAPHHDHLRLLAELHERTVAIHLRSLGDLAVVGGALGRAGVAWAVFKGPVLSERLYRRTDLRQYQDVDVLVGADACADAEDALVAAGAARVGGDGDTSELGQSHLVLPLGTVLDLHWDLVNRPEVRASLDVRSAEVLARRQHVRLGDVEVPTFDATDTVLHLALHAALAGGTRLLWLKDVERAAHAADVDWAGLTDRARAWRAAAPVGTVLARATRILGAPVPVSHLRDLAPAAVDRVVPSLLDRAWPPETCGPRAPSYLWTRFRRDTARRSAVVTVRRAAWAARQRAAGRSTRG